MNELSVVVKHKKTQRYLELIKSGKREIETLSLINNTRINISCFAAAIISISPMISSILLHVLQGVHISGWVQALSILWIPVGLIGSLILLPTFEYDRKDVLKNLEVPDQEKVLQLIELNEKRAEIFKTYTTDPDMFVLSCFGAYNYELVLRIRAEVKKRSDNKEDYLIALMDPESEEHKTLKVTINPANSMKGKV